MNVKQLDHINLSVRDLDESLNWYARVFGFALVERDVKNGIPWAIVRADEAMLALYEHPRRVHHDRFALSDHHLHGMNHFALRVDDPRAWLRRSREAGVEFLYEGEVAWPHSSSWYVTDPTGYEIEVVHWKDATIRFSAV